MGLVLALALLAGDPAADWADESPTAPAPAASPTPPPATVAPAVDPDVDWSVEKAEPPESPEALDKTFRLSLELGAGVSPSSLGQLGVAVDFGWFPFRFVRLHVNIGSAWLPGSQPYGGGSSSDGALRILFGADGVLPFTWGELFMGLESGAAYSNATSQYYGYDCFNCHQYRPWEWQSSLRLRGGVDFTRLRPIVLGVDVAYGLFSRSFYSEVHWAELHGRVGFAF